MSEEHDLQVRYEKNVRARCSQEWHYRLIDRHGLIGLLECLTEHLQYLDNVKKALFYGREFAPPPTGTENYLHGGTEYKTRNLIHAILGIATESGELLEALLANLRDGKVFDEVNLQEEFGDVEWYRQLALTMLSQDHFSNIMQNDRKLEKRFGPAFDAERANNRNLDDERTTLEG